VTSIGNSRTTSLCQSTPGLFGVNQGSAFLLRNLLKRRIGRCTIADVAKIASGIICLGLSQSYKGRLDQRVITQVAVHNDDLA